MRKVQYWQSSGVNVSISQADARDLDGAKTLIQYAQKLGPIGGVFNLAMVSTSSE